MKLNQRKIDKDYIFNIRWRELFSTRLKQGYEIISCKDLSTHDIE